MAQPALTKNPLGITSFWQKASAEPPVEWDKWNQQLFLGIIAKDGVNLNKLLHNPPTIRKPQEPGYELNIEGETDKQIRDRNLRNQEKRVAWRTNVNIWIILVPPSTVYHGRKPISNAEVTYTCVWGRRAKDD